MSTDAMSIKLNPDDYFVEEEEEEEEEDFPDSVVSLHRQNSRGHVPPTVTSASPTVKDFKRTTAVDGKGMWRSWTRVYARPESACLDLLDNCFDAALQLTDDHDTEENSNQHFRGRVTMERHSDTAISIQNNSPSPIKPLEVALTVYKSSKNANLNGNAASRSLAQGNQDDKKDSIGENGVGLKQGCATLSDCSIVLMRNKRTVEIGVIAESLQTHNGIYLPSASFNVRVSGKDPHVINVEAGDRIRKWLSKHADIIEALGEAFSEPYVDDVDAISDQLTLLVKRLWADPWQDDDHVFLLFLFKLKKSAEVVPAQHDLMQDVVVSPAKAFIRDMKAILPEYYINLPSKGRFDFVIDQERTEFSFWQRRLVELTKFQINLPTDVPFESLSKKDWAHLTKESATNADDENTDDNDNGNYQMSIYCGFDAQRVDEDLQRGRGTSTCHLYIYSCDAGRLISKVIDARHMLGLVTSGVDYTQGLTIIINDVAGKLPLTPTKDGIAWSERKNGEIHQNNLMAWTGALAHFFWTHHRNQIGRKGNVKEQMKNLIRSFASKEQKEQMTDSSVTVTENMEDAQFTKFEGIQWRRVEPNYDNRWKIRKSYNPTTIKATKGPDTLFSLVRPQTKPKRCTVDAGRSGKRWKAGLSGSNEQDGNAAISEAWKEIDQKDIPRVASAVLGFFRSVDEQKLFEAPVLESLPHIKDEYMKVVSHPMDFKTIEEERIPSYTSITNLRDDLILTFQNSIQFNGPKSKFGKISQQMLDNLDDAIEATDIKRITTRVLSYFREVDQRELFAFPVLDQVPALEHSYLEVVKTPMDFKTIEEERVHSYTAISDLEDDLELIWDNCIQFNGPASVYGQIAQQMKDMADDIVYDVVMGKRMKKRKVHYDDIVDPAEDKKEKTESCPKKKRTYNALQKELRNTQKELAAERAENRQLRDHIRALEGNHQPPSAPASASHTRDISEGCLVCRQDSDYASILLCERCDAEYHFYCVGLPTIPTDDFYCSKC